MKFRYLHSQAVLHKRARWTSDGGPATVPADTVSRLPFENRLMPNEIHLSRTATSLPAAEQPSANAPLSEPGRRLLQVIQANDLEAFHALFNANMEEFGTDYYDHGENPLHVAVKCGSHAVAGALAEMSHELELDLIDKRDDAGYTPIMYVAESATEDVELIDALLHFGARVGLNEALKSAAQRGHAGIAKSLIASTADAPRVLAEITENDVTTGGVNAAKVMISAGADATDALIYAGEKHWRRAESALLLLGAKGADALVSIATQGVIDGNGKTYSTEKAKRLIDRGADATTALMKLARSPRDTMNHKVARILIEADREPRSYYGPTPAEGIAILRLMKSGDTAALQMWAGLRTELVFRELAKAGDVDTLKTLVTSYPDASMRTLRQYLEDGNLQAAKTLVAAGAPASELARTLHANYLSDRRHDLRPLHLAILAGAQRPEPGFGAMDSLDEKELKVSQYSPDERQGALERAVSRGDTEEVALLLNTEVDVASVLQSLGKTGSHGGMRRLFAAGLRASDALLERARAGDMDTAKVLIQASDVSNEVLIDLIAFGEREPARALIGILRDRGQQALAHAAASNDIPLAAALIELGADGPGTLIAMLGRGNREAATRLVAAGADIHTALVQTITIPKWAIGTTQRDIFTLGADCFLALQKAVELDDKVAIKWLAARDELPPKVSWVLDHETMATEQKANLLRMMFKAGVNATELTAKLATSLQNTQTLRFLTSLGMRTDDVLAEMAKQGNRIDTRNLIVGGGDYIEAMRSLRENNQHEAVTILGVALAEARDRMMAQ